MASATARKVVTMAGLDRPIVRLEGLTHRYAKTPALQNITLEIPRGCLVGLIGPDGVGKSSLSGIVAGAKRIQTGSVEVLGGDMADGRHRAAICPRVAYMPQGLGKNLYADLSARENIEFFARLFGQNRVERETRIANLLDSTGLTPFADRLARNLSGGMRRSSACAARSSTTPTSSSSTSRRRRRSPLAPPVLGADRAHAAAPARHERHDRNGLYGGGGTVRLADRDARWPGARSGSPVRLKAETGAQSIEDIFIALLPRS